MLRWKFVQVILVASLVVCAAHRPMKKPHQKCFPLENGKEYCRTCTPEDTDCEMSDEKDPDISRAHPMHQHEDRNVHTFHPPHVIKQALPAGAQPTCGSNHVGMMCYTDDCCPYFYQCNKGVSSPIYATLSDSVCFKGELIRSNDCRCKDIQCDLSTPVTPPTTAPTYAPPITTAPTYAPPTQAPPTTKAPVPSGNKIFVGYYTNWSQYRSDKGTYLPENIDPTKFTHLVYSFAYIKRDEWSIVQVEWNDINPYQPDQSLYKRFNNHIRSRNPKCKTLIAIGGWNFNFKEEFKDIFTHAVESAANRATVIASLVKWARDNSFDGIDLDWEYPGVPAMGGRPQDKANFQLFVKELREAITKDATQRGKTALLLTLAVGAGRDKIDLAYDVPGLVPYVDYISVMTYDLHGAWDAKTGGSSNLYPPQGYQTGSEDEYYTIEYALNYWMQKGAPKDKLVVGLSAYGRGWQLVSSTPNQPMGSPAKGASPSLPYSGEPGVLTYYEALDLAASGGSVALDSATQTMYVQKGDMWYTYDSPETIRVKAQYILDNGFKGGMVWAVDNDAFFNGNPIISAAYSVLNPVAEEGGWGLYDTGDILISSTRELMIPLLVTAMMCLVVGVVVGVVVSSAKYGKEKHHARKRNDDNESDEEADESMERVDSV